MVENVNCVQTKCPPAARRPYYVMAGLVPAIHVLHLTATAGAMFTDWHAPTTPSRMTLKQKEFENVDGRDI